MFEALNAFHLDTFDNDAKENLTCFIGDLNECFSACTKQRRSSSERSCRTLGRSAGRF